MNRTHHKTKLVVILLVASCLISAPAVLADIGDFSNPSLWQLVTYGTGFSATANTTELYLTIPVNTTGTAVASGLFTVSGDFDVQVNYSLDYWLSSNDTGLSLSFHTLAGSAASISVGLSRDGHGFSAVYAEDQYEDKYIALPGSNLSGALRLTRVGNTITGYYWDEAWLTVSSDTALPLDLDGIFMVGAGNAVAIPEETQNIYVTFSNFSEVPIPPALVLLGSGLVGLGLTGLRRRMKKS